MAGNAFVNSPLRRRALWAAAVLGWLAFFPVAMAQGVAGVAGVDGVAPSPGSYAFGVLPQRSAVLTAQYWNPIFDYVRRRTSIALVLKVARSGDESGDLVARGEYDFVYSNHIFQPRMTGAGYKVILRPLDEAIRGQIVVAADSPLRTLKDLQGKVVGFPSATAFVGYVVPLDALRRAGVTVTPAFGGNQEGIMGQLKVGKVLAAGVNDQLMKAYAEREGLAYRVIWESPAFLNLPVAVHPRVPMAVVEAVRVVLDEMDTDAEGRRILEASAVVIGQKPPLGFRSATSANYQSYVDFYRSSLVQDQK